MVQGGNLLFTFINKIFVLSHKFNNKSGKTQVATDDTRASVSATVSVGRDVNDRRGKCRTVSRLTHNATPTQSYKTLHSLTRLFIVNHPLHS